MYDNNKLAYWSSKERPSNAMALNPVLASLNTNQIGPKGEPDEKFRI